LSRFFFICFTITTVKKIFRYTEDFVIQGFVMSRFNCIQKIPVAENSQLLNGPRALTHFHRVCRNNMVKTTRG